MAAPSTFHPGPLRVQRTAASRWGGHERPGSAAIDKGARVPHSRSSWAVTVNQRALSRSAPSHGTGTHLHAGPSTVAPGPQFSTPPTSRSNYHQAGGRANCELRSSKEKAEKDWSTIQVTFIRSDCGGVVSVLRQFVRVSLQGNFRFTRRNVFQREQPISCHILCGYQRGQALDRTHVDPPQPRAASS